MVTVKNCSMCWQERTGTGPFRMDMADIHVCLSCKKQITAVIGFLAFYGMELSPISEKPREVIAREATEGPKEAKK